jgi:Spy/CpxP family protein refolding chaperone
MKRLWYLVLALSLGLNAGLLWVHFHHRSEHERRGSRRGPAGERGPRSDSRAPEVGKAMVERHLARLEKELDLTPEQRTSIAAIWEQNMPAIRATRERLRGLRSEMRDGLAAAEIDSTALRVLARQAAAAQVELDSLTAGTMLAEAHHLQPEQRRRYAEIMPWVSPGRMLDGRPGRPRDKTR